MVSCPHCLNQVTPSAGGICPVCGQLTNAPAATPPEGKQTSAGPNKDLWESYRWLMETPALPPEIRQVFAMEARALMRREATSREPQDAMRADRELLEAIRRDILPQCWRAQEVLVDNKYADSFSREQVEQLHAFVVLRVRAWKRMEQAFEQRSQPLAQQHAQLMQESQQALNKILSSRNRSGSQGQIAQFFSALVTFTPTARVTSALVLVNSAVFLAVVVAGGSLFQPPMDIMLRWGANFGPLTLNGEWWRLITSTFLHFGLLHVGLNMWVLWQLGRLVERLVGNTGFLVLYFASGIFASITSLAWHSHVVSAGASGAVFGVGGAFLGFLLLRRDTVPIEVLKPLRASLFAFIGYNVIFGMLIPAIDMAAHLGGLAFGFACGLIMSQPLKAGIRRRRWRRDLACVLGAAMILPATFKMLPPARIPIQTRLAPIAKLESKALRAYESLRTNAGRGTISNAELASGVEETVLPPWRRAMSQLRSMMKSAEQDKEQLKKVVDSMELRRQSFQLLVEALRENDPKKMAEHDKKWDAANNAAKAIGFAAREP